MLENPVTGERVEVLESQGDCLSLRVTWPRPGARAQPHLHPRMEERWTVLRGRAGFRIGDAAERELGPGESIVAAMGVAHVAWNAGSEPAVLRIEMRPGLRWLEFVERLFAGESPGDLLSEYRDEITLPTR